MNLFDTLSLDHWMMLAILVFQVGQFATRTTERSAGLNGRVDALEEWVKAHTKLHDAEHVANDGVFMRKDLVVQRLEVIERRLDTLERKIDSLPGRRRPTPRGDWS